MEGHIVVNEKEIRRAQVLQKVVEGDLSLHQAADLLKIGYRQAKRLKADFLRDGLAGLVHGNRGKKPPNALPAKIRERVLDLHAEKYPDFNDCHFTEMLREKEDLSLSRETVRQLRRQNGIKPKRRRRPPKHRSRRPRKELPGAMVQWDGSPHRWFGEQSPPCCLMAAVDDAYLSQPLVGKGVHRPLQSAFFQAGRQKRLRFHSHLPPADYSPGQLRL